MTAVVVARIITFISVAGAGLALVGLRSSVG
jgi:hypothetical protein